MTKDYLILGILETKQIATKQGKTIILTWISSNASVTGNEIAERTVKEVTALIPTYQLSKILSTDI